MAATAGRRLYRWLVLLAAAVVLLVWMFIPAHRDGAGPSGGATTTPSADSSSSPTHEVTETNTPTTSPSTPPATEDPESGLPIVQLDDLPPEAARTLELIDAGGPFPEDRDGITFENREDLLPDHPMGYYREYTVPTPGSDDRGARRIIAGDGGEFYYTGDHYSSFSRIAR
jgi:ribonuclease T1